MVPISNTTIPRPLDEQTMDGSHAGEIFVTQFQAEPVESDQQFTLEEAIDREILAGLVDL